MLKKITNFFAYIISPPSCYQCKRELEQRTILCESCTKKIHPIATIPLKITEKTYIPIFAASDYHEPLKSLVLAKSWSNRTASRDLGELIWKHTTIAYLNFDYIIPIPLHWTRYAARGYNQAEEIARVISEKSGKPVVPILSRHRKTPFQTKIKSEERFSNVKNSFSILKKVYDRENSETILKNSFYYQKRILIVDDVMTSGSTLIEATKTLLPLKPTQIFAVVACRASR